MKPHRALRGAHLFGFLLAASSLVSCATSSASSASSSSSGIISDKQLKKQQQQQQHTEESSHLQQKAESALVKSLESAANSVISEKNNHHHPPSQQIVASDLSSNQQPAAEKKQGDSAPQLLQDSILSADEYVQIKPEEVSANEQVAGKELLDIQGNSNDAQQSQQQSQQQHQIVAEHKSAVDDELDAHLAQDSISQQESAYRPTYSAAGAIAAPSAPLRPLGVYPPVVRAPAYRPAAQRGPRSPARMPPSYITLKGKLTGFNSIISQYPHPAPGYPHQGPRHLPRGAAAGYAAFRDFVRAHASKYKHTTHLTSNPIGPHPPLPPSYGAPEPVPTRYAEQHSGAQAGKGYASPLSAGGYSNAPAAKTYRPQQPHSKTTKVTVAQAYIPHISGAPSSYNSASAQQSIAPYVNPVLAKMYGGHAPQGAGKAEYSKDYGMVIHYPQATVYTEPMTVDQLHKLTGAGISQVLEQLQYNLAHGHRDESNTIRAHSKHHLGHGISIHAKEYYAPGKAGHYVPTTAAVLSTNGAAAKGSSAAYGDQSGAEGAGATYGPAAAAAQKPLELGSGYERVKQAVANSQAKYSGAASAAAPTKYSSQDYQSHADAEPLSAITSFLGSELESLYKANSALTKHLEPEIHQAVAKAASYHAKASPLKYTDLGMKSPFGAHGLPLIPAAPYSVPRPATRYQRGRGPRGSPQGGDRYAQRPHSPGYQSNGHRAQQQQQQYQQHGPRAQPYAQQQQSYQQNQAYHAAEQALNQQVMQLLHDFQSGDDQYNSKSQPLHATNQGYPHKVMQKYQQQAYAQQQQQQQQASYGHQQQQAAAYGANQQVSGYSLQQSLPYAHQDGLEIPQGSNDQIGEIADLIESLKGALDLNKPDGAEGNYASQPAGKQHKQEEVRYLASTLGQPPSYALQVPVSGSNGYQDKKPADSYQQQQQSAYAAPALAYQAEQQQRAYQVQPEAPAAGYQQQAVATYGAAQSGGYGSAQQQQQQQPASYQQQPASDYQNAAVATGYASSAQPQTAQASPTPAAYQQAATYQAASGYQQQASGYQQQQQSAGSGYQQQQAAGYQAQVAPAEQPASTSYSVNEHAQVIDHLVPGAAPQQVAASSAYGADSSVAAALSSGANHQPALQIGLTAPTDSHYQQAQSLSSFVDSLPTDYQEILRQPALLDGHSNVSHLAIQEGASSTSSQYTNATSAAAAAPVAPASSSSSSATHSSYDVHQPVQQQQQQQQVQHQQQAYESGKSASTGGSSTAVASQQYSTVKK